MASVSRRSCSGQRIPVQVVRQTRIRTVFSVNARGSIAGRDWYEWLPIHDMTTDAVFATIRDAGQQPHWAYAAGNRRLSCVFCIMGHPADLANGARHHPELYAKYLEIEARTGYTMHQSRRSLRDIVEQATLQAGQATPPT